MFTWFKPKNKKNVVLPSLEQGKLQGQDLVIAFTDADEPKVQDFPKEKYSVYWEIVLSSVAGGYQAKVVFYPFNGGQVVEHTLTKSTPAELRQEVSILILATMEKARKV